MKYNSSLNPKSNIAKTVVSLVITAVFLLFAYATTDNDSTSNSSTSDSKTSQQDAGISELIEETPALPALEELPAEFLGYYKGVQESYIIRDENGPIIIYGLPVEVPAVEFIYTLSKDNNASLRETDVSTGESYVFSGGYEIIETSADTIKIKVSLIGSGSHRPEYQFDISTFDFSGYGKNASGLSPRFPFTKIYYE